LPAIVHVNAQPILCEYAIFKIVEFLWLVFDLLLHLIMGGHKFFYFILFIQLLEMAQ
jgi:hypothetical protein